MTVRIQNISKQQVINPATEIFDLVDFVRRNLGDLEIARDVALTFIGNHLEYLESIKAAVEDKDAAALSRTAHKLKGAAANIALPQVTDISGRIESNANTGNISTAEELIPELEQKLTLSILTVENLFTTASLSTGQGSNP